MHLRLKQIQVLMLIKLISLIKSQLQFKPLRLLVSSERMRFFQLFFMVLI